MQRRAAVLTNGAEVHLDDIVPMTNPVQQMDIARIMFWTPESRRPYVALAFLDRTQEEWCRVAGLEVEIVRHWLKGRTQMPLGGAFRLAKAMGLSIEELFPGFMEPQGHRRRSR